MCPSTSCGTWRGSQFGICPATTVIRPKLNDARPRRKRMTRSARRRSLRIRRRRKRRILALYAQERLLSRGVDAAGLLFRAEHRRARLDGSRERQRDVVAAAEQPGGLRGAAGADPGLVGAPGGRSLKPADDERRVSTSRDDERSTRERDRTGVRTRENRGDLLLACERSVAAVELVRKRRGPDTEDDGCDRRDCGRRRDRDGPARPQRDDVRTLAPCLLQDAGAELGRRQRRLDSVGECAGRVRQRRELVAAALAAREVRLVLARVLGVEGVERVGSGQVVEGVGFHAVSPLPGSASSSRRRARPVNILLLIVPTGCPSLSASSDWLKPP